MHQKKKKKEESLMKTNPLRDIGPPLLGNKLQNTSVRVPALFSIDHFHQQRPLHMQLGHLVQCRGRKDDFGAVVELWSFGPGGHDDRIASVVLVEALNNWSPAASHVVEVLRVGRVEPASKSRLKLDTEGKKLVRDRYVQGTILGDLPWLL